jgi:hypothetical protein
MACFMLQLGYRIENGMAVKLVSSHKGKKMHIFRKLKEMSILLTADDKKIPIYLDDQHLGHGCLTG